jgi:hypothetical protein
MADHRHVPLASEPRLRHRPRADLDARILDPNSAPVVQGFPTRPTIYVGNRLIVAKGDRCQHQVDILKEVAKSLGWVAREDPEKARTKGLKVGVITVSITAGRDSIDRAPDAWYLLQKARQHLKRKHKDELSGLDSTMSSTPGPAAQPV